MTPDQKLELSGTLVQLAAALAKDATVADVHVTSAGGGRPPKKKPLLIADDELEPGSDHRPEPNAQLDKVHAFDMPFRITKADPDQRRVWGWASISQLGEQVVIDKQGDIIPIAELEKAAYDFVLHSRSHGDMHSKFDVGRSIESMVFTPEKEAAGIVAKDANGKSIFGWWIGLQVDDENVWKDYRAGKRPEFSIGGKSSWVDEATA